MKTQLIQAMKQLRGDLQSGKRGVVTPLVTEEHLRRLAEVQRQNHLAQQSATLRYA